MIVSRCDSNLTNQTARIFIINRNNYVNCGYFFPSNIPYVLDFWVFILKYRL